MTNIFRNKNLRVLAYHKVNDQKRFERQLDFLKRRYQLINLKALRGYLLDKQDLPKNALLITFDDGDVTVYENAFPILKKYNIPAVIFIITDLIDTAIPFWWDEIEYYIGTEKGNQKVWEVKNWTNRRRLDFLKSLREKSKKSSPVYPQLTSVQLTELQFGGVDIANHSHTHPMFDQCTVEELENEMVESKKNLTHLGLAADTFAYPNGNYSEISEEILKKNGVKLAFLFDHKVNKVNVSPLRISRLIVNDSTSMWKLRFILSGWHGKFLPVIKRVSGFFRKVKK
ncbi:polysaccharide deacetylase family protein [Salinimicrobium xinjiangense]|uniref:polysaccharide deacetylase family protein n=1 Tax=Salinimicrobium xinjiangense TaxID=438596 RepID=UPI000419AED8|nr:polysaccharide deacetylase family protein [Salinimicrobium xinjiangense]